MKIVVDKHLPFVVPAFGSLGEVELLDTSEFTVESVRGADVLVIRSETRVGPALIEGSRVRFIGSASVGRDHVDVEALERRGIAFAGAPGCNSDSVKEYIVAALLESAARLGTRLAGKTLGVVGVGAIGSKVARAAEALGLRVLLNDPPLARAGDGREFRPLNDLMAADILTLHVPLTRTGPDPTFHLFDRRRLARVKRGAVVINSSRGAVVETAALKEALAGGRLAAAVLDVWENEPDIDFALQERSLIGTAHVAGYSLEGKANAVRIIREAICSHFGIDSAWNPGPLLGPAPAAPTTVPAGPLEDEEALRSVVKSAYDIMFDDEILRALRDVPAEARPAAFSRLRSGYRVRREFSAMTVRIPGSRTMLAGICSVLGFRTAVQP